MTRQSALSLLKRFGPTCFGLLLLVGALYVVQREFRGLSWQDIQTALHATPAAGLWLAAGCTVGAYLLLSAYDRLGSIYAGHPVSWRRSLLASFCAYSLANNIGVATVSGAAVRYRFYTSWGLAPVAIAKVIAITSLTFGLGGFAIAGTVLVLEPDLLGFLGPGAPRWILPLIGFLCWAIVITYVVLARFVPHIRLFGHEIDLPGFRIAIAQVALATADVAVTAMIFYALLPPADGLSFLHFLGIYIAAYMAGLAANVPGGIGVFDGAILFALAGFMPTPAVVGALLLFRLFYYIIPLFLAGALFAGFEISQRRKLVARLAPDRGIAVSFEVSALAGLTGLAALALIFIGALPPKPSLLGPVPDILEEAASHFAASVVGSLLLAAAYGLVRRLTLAWWASIFLLLNGVLILVLRGEPLWLIAAFLLVPLLLMTARAAFYRRAQLIGEAISADGLGALAAGAICGLTLATVAYQSDLADQSWWGVVLAADAPESLRFTVGLAAVLLLVAAFRLLLPARPPSMAYTEAARERLLALGGMAPGLTAADGAVFGEAGRAGFAFLRRDGVWLALGDPVGEPRDRVSAIWRFRDLCEAAQVDPAFWRVGPELLRIYSDIGLTALALEPDGTAPRYLVCRAERDLDNLRALLPHGGAGGEAA